MARSDPFSRCPDQRTACIMCVTCQLCEIASAPRIRSRPASLSAMATGSGRWPFDGGDLQNGFRGTARGMGRRKTFDEPHEQDLAIGGIVVEAGDPLIYKDGPNGCAGLVCVRWAS
jgi:hypothetical protein